LLAALRYKLTIQKFAALFLLLVFFISSAPKAYFHDLVADHKDFSDCQQPHHSTVLHQQGLNCHFDDLVVTSAFVLLVEQQVSLLDLCFEKKQRAYHSLLLSSALQHKENRGPPSV
jgi:hypothetical protein